MTNLEYYKSRNPVSDPFRAPELKPVFYRPCRGLNFFDVQTHGFTAGYWLARLRR
jgi:hypothetical protein